jgi:hypothetical protein
MRYFVFALAFVLPAAAADHNALLPRPQKIHYGGGRLVLGGLSVRFASSPNAEDRFAAGELVSALSERAGTKIPVTDDAQVIYRMSLPAMAFGSVAPWQSVPVDREHFFSNYAHVLYPPAVAAEVAPALEALAKSQQSFTAALGAQTMHRFWDDPLATARLKHLQEHKEDLHQGRLQAEDAAEHLYRALAQKGDLATLSSLLLGASLLDYLGMKNIYAVQIAGFFEKLGPNPQPDLANLLLRTEVSAQDHGFLADLMDNLTELREPYRNAWLAEYTPYRLQAAWKRWDSEYEYWHTLQDPFQNFRLSERQALPPLDSFRPRQEQYE